MKHCEMSCPIWILCVRKHIPICQPCASSRYPLHGPWEGNPLRANEIWKPSFLWAGKLNTTITTIPLERSPLTARLELTTWLSMSTEMSSVVAKPEERTSWNLHCDNRWHLQGVYMPKARPPFFSGHGLYTTFPSWEWEFHTACF